MAGIGAVSNGVGGSTKLQYNPHLQEVVHCSCLVREEAVHTPQLQGSCHRGRQGGSRHGKLHLPCRHLLDMHNLQQAAAAEVVKRAEHCMH